MAKYPILEPEQTGRTAAGLPHDPGPASHDAQQVLRGDSLETLAAAFGFHYDEQRRVCPDEEEAILGRSAYEYARVARSQPQRYSEFIQALTLLCRRGSGPAEDAIIVDLGSGVGLLTLEIARRFPQARVYGIDVSPDMVSIAEEFLRMSEPTVRSRVQFHASSVYELDSTLRHLRIRQADVVLSRNTLHRLKRPSLGVQQMLDAVRSGGALYLTAFCGDLDTTDARADLVRSVKQRFQDSNGQTYWEFCRCYLSAVLRSPGRKAYEELIGEALRHRRCRDRESAYRSYAGEIKLLL